MESKQTNDDFYFGIELTCNVLPTVPLKNIGKVLVTGASGYIGGRLIPELLARGYKVRAMVRGDSLEYAKRWPQAEVVVADALDTESLKTALKDIDTAYYLLHSLLLGPKDFGAMDINAAWNFRQIAEQMNIKRIIYLGGLGDLQKSQSTHLRNRVAVAEELRKGKVPVTILRAGIIIGSGSASYEIIKNLVIRAPFLLIPRWAKNKIHPIAIRDVLKHLVGVLEIPDTSRSSFDISGESELTYEEMLKIIAEVLNKRIIFIPCFFSNIEFYSYFASLLTPVPAPITYCLMEGLRDNVLAREHTIDKFIKFEKLSYKAAVVKALTREEQDRVYTRWSDAYPPAHELALKLHELKKNPTYIAHYTLSSKKSSRSIFNCLCQIGGKGGWFHNNWMWRLRGLLDRVLLGVGSQRGRRQYSDLKVNDVIDFWRIEDLIQSKRILLRAEMKLPGRAWLEFNIQDKGTTRELSVTAYFETKRIIGKLYWYAFMPFHNVIFQRLIEDIEQKS